MPGYTSTWNPGVSTYDGGAGTTTDFSGSGSGSGNGNGGQGPISDVQDLISADIIPEATTVPVDDLTYAEELAGIASEREFENTPWDFNPDNPNNWLGYENAYNLGKFIATDSQGKPILDSRGNVIWSGLGQHIMEQDGGNMNLENLQGIEKEYFKERAEEEERSRMLDQGQEQAGYGYGYDPGSYTVAGGYGYGGGDPNQVGKTPFYGDPYSEARYAPMDWHKRMVDVNSPLYAARGGIMSLRR